MIIKNNILSKYVFGKLYSEIVNARIPWYHVNTTYSNNASSFKYDYSWEHIVFSANSKASPLFDLIDVAILSALDNAGQSISEMYRIRIGLITATGVPYEHEPHIDLNEEHKTGLLYITNSDGPTTIYNEIYQPVSGLNGLDYYNNILSKAVTVNKKLCRRQINLYALTEEHITLVLHQQILLEE